MTLLETTTQFDIVMEGRSRYTRSKPKSRTSKGILIQTRKVL